MSTSFIKETNTHHTISLTSSLIYAVLKNGIAWGGGVVELEVRTVFVGNGAPIEIIVQGTQSKKIVRFKDHISGNWYHAKVALPPNLKLGEEVWFDVKIADLGLSGISQKIPAFPKPDLLSMSWGKEVVYRGEVVTLHADFDNVLDYMLVTICIYEYDETQAHIPITQIPITLTNKQVRLQWAYDFHDNTEQIPVQSELDPVGGTYVPPRYFFVVDFGGLRIGDEQESELLEFRERYRAVVRDCFDMPLADQKVILHLPEGEEKECTTDSEGCVVDEELKPGTFYVEILSHEENAS